MVKFARRSVSSRSSSGRGAGSGIAGQQEEDDVDSLDDLMAPDDIDNLLPDGTADNDDLDALLDGPDDTDELDQLLDGPEEPVPRDDLQATTAAVGTSNTTREAAMAEQAAGEVRREMAAAQADTDTLDSVLNDMATSAQQHVDAPVSHSLSNDQPSRSPSHHHSPVRTSAAETTANAADSQVASQSMTRAPAPASGTAQPDRSGIPSSPSTIEQPIRYISQSPGIPQRSASATPTSSVPQRASVSPPRTTAVASSLPVVASSLPVPMSRATPSPDTSLPIRHNQIEPGPTSVPESPTLASAVLHGYSKAASAGATPGGYVPLESIVHAVQQAGLSRDEVAWVRMSLHSQARHSEGLRDSASVGEAHWVSWHDCEAVAVHSRQGVPVGEQVGTQVGAQVGAHHTQSAPPLQMGSNQIVSFTALASTPPSTELLQSVDSRQVAVAASPSALEADMLAVQQEMALMAAQTSVRSSAQQTRQQRVEPSGGSLARPLPQATHSRIEDAKEMFDAGTCLT